MRFVRRFIWKRVKRLAVLAGTAALVNWLVEDRKDLRRRGAAVQR
jgi:hypothetical protein